MQERFDNSHTSQARKRDHAIEILMGFGIVMVVLGHKFQPPLFYFHAYSFQVALFFFASGYLAHAPRPPDKNKKKIQDSPAALLLLQPSICSSDLPSGHSGHKIGHPSRLRDQRRNKKNALLLFCHSLHQWPSIRPLRPRLVPYSTLCSYRRFLPVPPCRPAYRIHMDLCTSFWCHNTPTVKVAREHRRTAINTDTNQFWPTFLLFWFFNKIKHRKNKESNFFREINHCLPDNSECNIFKLKK